MSRQTQWLFEVPVALEGDRGANLEYSTHPELAASLVAEIPKEGSFYQIKKGDTLLKIARKAYGVVPGSELRKLARLINEDPYNLRVRRSEPVDLFPEGIISFYPEFVCGFAAQSQSAGKPASGSCYAIIKIPARRVVTFDDGTKIVGRLPDTLDRIIKRALELIQQLEHFGTRITPYQQQRIRCILLQLSQPGFDDRFLTGQGLLDYQNGLYDKPRFDNATQCLLPKYIVSTKEKRTDVDIWRTLIRIDQDITYGRQLINRIYATHSSATPIRVQQLRDWVDKQEHNPRSLYRCYKLQSQ
jgi:hypothetical protein